MTLLSVTPDADTMMSGVNTSTNSNAGVISSTVLVITDAKVEWLRGLMRFDISAIPPGETITAVEMRLGGITAFALVDHLIARSDTNTNTWVERECTWDDYKTATAWDSGGGDFTTTNQFTDTNQPSSGTWTIPTNSDFVAQLQTALDSDSGIYSVLVRMADEDPAVSSGANWHSKDFDGDSDPPVLDVIYGAASAFVPQMMIF